MHYPQQLQTVRPTIGAAINYAPKFDLFYITNEKAGCSTFKQWLMRLHLDDPGFSVENIHLARDILPLPKAIGWDYIQDSLEGRNAAFVFTFVRHPLRRCIAAYYDRMIRQRRRSNPTLQPFIDRQLADDETIGFDEFLSIAESVTPQQMDPHWRPQHVNILHGSIVYDVIGRLETAEADIRVIIDRAKLPDGYLTPRNRRTPEGFTENILAARPDRVRRIEALYERDYELFGYDQSEFIG